MVYVLVSPNRLNPTPSPNFSACLWPRSPINSREEKKIHFQVSDDVVLRGVALQLTQSVDPKRKESGEKGRNEEMLLAVLISNSEGNILVERFNGVPAEERLHWRSFLVKLGADNLKGAKNEELFVASHKSVYIVYTVLGDVCVYVVGKDEYDELALAEAIFVITSTVKDVCGKPPTERLFLDKYGKICLCLDEIVWKGILENTEKDRIKRLIRLRPPTEF